MTTDPTNAPERIWLLRADVMAHVKDDRPVPINAWDFGGECDIPYTRTDLCPGAKRVDELEAAIHAHCGRMANLLQRWGPDGGATITAMRRHVVALAALTEKGK